MKPYFELKCNNGLAKGRVKRNDLVVLKSETEVRFGDITDEGRDA